MVASTERDTLLAQGPSLGQARLRAARAAEPFRAALKDNALTQLHESQARLREKLATYADFNSPAWDELRQAATKDNQLQEFELKAVEDLEQFISKTFYGGAPFVAAGTGFVFPAPAGDLSARREKILEHFQNHPHFSAENKEQLGQLIDQLDLADQTLVLQAQLRQQYPALNFLESPVSRDRSNGKLYEIISQEYGQAIEEIQGLAARIEKDPARALHLDRVRERTLQQYPEAREWVEDRLKNAKQLTQLGTVSTTVLGVGSFFVPPLAVPAAVIGTATARHEQKLAEDNYDAALADIWSEEGSGLTSTALDEARGNLIGARVNLALGVIDLGWTAGATAITKLGPRAANTLSALDPSEVAKIIDASQLHRAGRTDEAIGALQQVRSSSNEEARKLLDELVETLPEAPSKPLDTQVPTGSESPGKAPSTEEIPEPPSQQPAPLAGTEPANPPTPDNPTPGNGSQSQTPPMAIAGVETLAEQAQRLGQQLSDLNLPGLNADRVSQIAEWAAGDRRLAYAIDGVLNGSGQLRNLDHEKGLYELAKRYGKHNQPGSLRELEVAAARVRQGHDVEFNLGADVVDHTTQEALQIKNVTSGNLKGVQNNFAKAVQQLSGEKGEIVPQRPNRQPFERISELVINNPKNPFFAGTAEDIAKKLRKYLTDPTVFDDYPLPEGKPPSDFVDSIRITNKNGTHTFEVIRDGQGRFQDIKIHEANQPRLISQRPSGQLTIVPESDGTTLATQPLTAVLATAQISDFSPNGRNRAYEMVGSLIDRLKENDLQPTRLPTGDLLVLTLDGKMEISDRNGEPKFVYDHEKGKIQVSSEIHQDFLVEIGPNEPSARENDHLEVTA